MSDSGCKYCGEPECWHGEFCSEECADLFAMAEEDDDE